MIIVFTGNGKGKTTAALGQAIRALGQGKKVLMIQFIKNITVGEHKFFSSLFPPAFSFEIIKGGKGFVNISGDKSLFLEHKKVAQKTLELVAQKIKSKKYDLIILDEINVAVNLKLIKAVEVLKIFKKYQCQSTFIDIILTGRNAPKSFIKISSLTTEMKEIKHPFQRKKMAKIGIEF